MRIAYLCADPGIPVTGTKGASIHVQQIVRAFLRRGDDVVVYCTRLGDGEPIEGVRYVDLPLPRTDAAGRERAVAAAAAQLAVLANADGCDLVYERYSLFSDAAARIDAPAIVEVNAPLIDEQRQHRSLVDVSTAWSTTRSLLGAASVVACVSEPVAAWARDHAGDARVVVAPNGVDTRAFHEPVRRGRGSLQTVFVGSLKPWHGVEVAIDAVAATDGVELTIVGDGPEREARAAQAAPLGDRVRWTGALPHADVAAVLARADVGLAPYPARAADYFSPLKVYEYLAAGVATVASDVGQLPAVIEHGETGILVPAGDAEALAGALRSLRDDRALVQRLGSAARAAAVARHDWDRVLEGILAAMPSAATAGVAA